MNDFNTMHALYHSEIAKRVLEDKKRSIEVVNTDFLSDLPRPVLDVVEQIRWNYSNRSWFHEAWEEYRKHVLDAGLGGKIKMPGAIFNKYLDKYESKELEKIYKTDVAEAVHSEELCEDYLAHYGVKGQKWGVRRYQNEDGTLTEEGMARYGVDEHGNMTKEGRALYDKDAKSALKEDASKRKKLGVAAGTAIGAAVLTGAYVGGKLISRHANQKFKTLATSGKKVGMNDVYRLGKQDKFGKKMSIIAGKTDSEGKTHFSVGKLFAAALLAGATGKLIAKGINRKKKAEQEEREKHTEQYLNSIEYENQIKKRR